MSNLDSSQRRALLEEAIEIIKFSDIHLGNDEPTIESDPLKKKVIELLNGLNQEVVYFSPKLNIYPLTDDNSQIKQDQNLSELQSKMQNHNFYKIDIPVTLKSAPNWAFSSLVCNIAFCPDEENSKEVHLLPTIHDIFPSDEWQELLSIQNSLTLGLNENLEFRLETNKIEAESPKLSIEAQARLSTKIEGKTKFAFGPFNYAVRKAKIKSRGRGNIKAVWDFQGAKYLNEQEIKLGVILMIPKTRNKPINVTGALEVHHDFQVWSADILKFQNFFDGIQQQFFESGAAIQKSEIWRDIIRID